MSTCACAVSPVHVQAKPWFCIPHAASDDWVASFAALLLSNLRPDLQVYIEYSNEVWNRGFPQNAHAAAMGLQLGLATTAADAAVRYHKLRSLQVRGSPRGQGGGRYWGPRVERAVDYGWVGWGGGNIRAWVFDISGSMGVCGAEGLQACNHF